MDARDFARAARRVLAKQLSGSVVDDEDTGNLQRAF